MRRCISLLLSVSLLFGLFSGGQVARADIDPSEEMLRLYQEGDYWQGAALADAYLDQPGMDTRFIHHAAICYYNIGRFEDAADTHEWLISFGFTDRYSIAAYYSLGMIYALTGEYQKTAQCLEEYRRVAESAELLDAQRTAFYHYGHAFLQFYLGNLDQAVARMEQSLSFQELGNTTSVIASFYLRKGEDERALEIYMQAEADATARMDDAAQAMALGDIAYFHLNRNEYDAALEAANRAIALDPETDYAHIAKAIALCCSETGDLQDALAHLTIAETYAVLPGKTAYLSAWRGVICEKLGDEAAARDAFDAALRFVPGVILGDHYYLAMIYALAGDVTASIAALDYVCERVPGFKYDVTIDVEFDRIRDTPEFQAFVRNNHALLPSGATLPSNWAQREVDTARAYRLIPAALDGDYQRNITRAEFCTLAVALIEVKTGASLADLLAAQQDVPEPGVFSDTDNDDVWMISRLGIVNGYGDGTFGPDDPITREQAAAMLTRLAKVLGLARPNAAPLSFADTQAVSPWAADGVTFVSGCMADGNRVMGGTGNDLFSPEGSYTREQSFMTFLRLYQCTPNPVTELTLS